MLATSSCCETPGCGDHLDRVVATGRAEHLGSGVRRERDDLRAGRAVGAAVGRDAGEAVLLRAGLAHDVHRLADGEVALVGATRGR